MNSVPLQIAGLGFWLALALVVVALVWAGVRKQQMKHDLTLKLLEKGQDVNTELLARLMSSEGPRDQKSAAERHREAGGTIGLMFLLFGLLIGFFALARQSGISWPLLGLGAFTVVLGLWTWYGTMKEYHARKELEAKDLP